MNIPGARAAWTGYLPALGPSPLRFQTPVDPSFRFVLPPLPRSDAAPATVRPRSQPVADRVAPLPPESLAAVDTVAVSPAPLDVPSGDAGPGAAPVIAEADPGGMPNLPPPASPPPPLTPQMLVPYFQPIRSGTNGANGMVALPLDFTPPLPLASPASRASYHSH